MNKSKLLAVVGLVLVLFWFMGDDSMDEETALARYGHADGTPATSEEILEARDSYSPQPRRTWLLVTGVVLMIPFVLQRPWRENRQ